MSKKRKTAAAGEPKARSNPPRTNEEPSPVPGRRLTNEEPSPVPGRRLSAGWILGVVFGLFALAILAELLAR